MSENKDKKVQFVGFTTKRPFGLELEICNKKDISQKDIANVIGEIDKNHAIRCTEYEKTLNNAHWHIKPDGSCGEPGLRGGWEIVSFVSKGHEDLKMISDVANACLNAGAKTNDKCGFHIHVQVDDFSDRKLSHLLENYLKIEHILLESVPQHRRVNNYCRSLAQFFNGMPLLNYEKKELWSNLYKTSARMDRSNIRNRTLNLCYCVERQNNKTIELRLPEGTLDANNVKNWVRLLICFINNQRKTYKKEFDIEPIDIKQVDLQTCLQILGLSGNDDFYLLSSAIRSTKLWFLRRIIKHSKSQQLIKEAKNISQLIKY